MTITQVGAVGTSVVSGTTVSAVVPAGVINGDLLLCSVANVFSAASVTPPAGWTQIDTGNAGTTLVAGLYYRIASGETAGTTSYTWTTGGARSESMIVALRGQNVLSLIDNSGGAHAVASSNTAATTIPYPSVTTATASALVLGFGWGRNATAGLTNSTWTAPTSWTELADITSTTASANELTGELVTITPGSTGATGTANATLNNSSTYVAFTIGIAPVATGGGGAVAFRAASSAALASASSQSLTLPAGILGGDLILLFLDIGLSTTMPTYTVPTGYTDVLPGGFPDANATAGVLSTVFYKLAAGTFGAASSDAGATVTTTFNGAHAATLAASVYSGASLTNPIHATAHVQESTPGTGVTTQTAPSLATTAAAWVVQKNGGKGGATATTTYTTPGGTTKRTECYATGGSAMSGIVVDSNAILSAGTVGGSAFTSDHNQPYNVGWTIAILPATTGGTPPGPVTALTGQGTAPSTPTGSDGTIDLSWLAPGGTATVENIRTGNFTGCYYTYYPAKGGPYDIKGDGQHNLDTVTTHEFKTGATMGGVHIYRDSSSVQNYLKSDDLVMLNGGKLSTGTTVPGHFLEYISMETCIYGSLPSGMPTPAGSTKDYGGNGTNDVYTYQQIRNGVLDKFYAGVAARIATYGKPVLMGLDHETDNANNGNGGGNAKRSAAFRFNTNPVSAANLGDYAKALAHIQAIFDSQGATNVIWAVVFSGWRGTGDSIYTAIWPKNSDGSPMVDWVGWDPYRHLGSTAGDFDKLANYKPDSSAGWYDALDADFLGPGSGALPRFLGEFGVTYYTDNSRATTFIPSIITKLKTTRTKLKSINYYATGSWGNLHKDDGTWDSAALTAIGTVLADSYMTPTFSSTGVAAATYKVRNAAGTVVATITAPTVTAHLTGLAAGSYKYTVTAVASDGSESVPTSVTVVVPPSKVTFTAPTNLTATATDGTFQQYRFTFDAVPSAPAYIEERSTDLGVTFQVHGGVLKSPSFTTSDLVLNSTYVERVKVSDLAGNALSGPSNAVTVTSGSLPPPPSSSMSAASINGQVQLGWKTAPTGTYDVQRANDSAGAPGTYSILTTGVADTSYIDNTVSVGKTYWYRYRNVTTTGATSAWSDGVQVAVVAPVALVANLTVGPADGSADPDVSATVVLGAAVRFFTTGTAGALTISVDPGDNTGVPITVDPFQGYADYLFNAAGVYTATETAADGTDIPATDTVTVNVLASTPDPAATETATPRPIWVVATLAYAAGDLVDNTLYLALALDEPSNVTSMHTINGVQYAVGPGPAGPEVTPPVDPNPPGGV